MRLQRRRIVIDCGDNGPACRFDTSAEAASSREKVDGEGATRRSLQPTPLIEAVVVRSVCVPREDERC